MALLFCDGFDKYGPVAGVTATIQAALLAGEWTSASLSLANIVAGLSNTGYAVSFGVITTAPYKTLATSYSRLIGGIRIQSTLASAGGVTFLDSGTYQCSITINTTGLISIRTGGTSGTALSTSTVSVSANSTHYLEWDITFAASGAYQVWLDGVSLFSGTGATKSSSNSSANQFQLNGTNIIYDDLYLFDTTGSTNNAVLLTSPQIETQFPNADSSVQFSFGAAILGSAYATVASVGAPGANELFLRKVTTGPTGQLASVACIPQATSAGANFKSVVYADSAGSPTGSTLATGTQVTGTTSGTTLTSSFASPPTLSASTAYWLGFITDTSVNLSLTDNATVAGSKAANTYGSGPPTNPTMTTGQSSWLIYGNMTGIAVDWYEEDINPPPGDISYVSSSTSGNEDLYSFPALTTPNPANIYSVVVKGYIRRTDSGARTVSIQCKSGGTDSAATTVTPGTTYGWIDGNFDTDPATSSAWGASGVNSATSGFKIAS